MACVHAAQPSKAAPTYPAERASLRADIARLDLQGSQEQVFAAMESLRQLALRNGDQDQAQLVELERIFATHDDDAIDASLAAVNAVRAQVRPQASVELQEALSRIYGNLYFDAGNFQLALRHQLEALRLSARLPDGATKAWLYRLGTIAELYNAMGLPKDALRYANQALAGSGTADAPSGNRVSLLGARALALLQLGKTTEAEQALAEAERIDARREPGFNTLRLTANRATVESAKGNPAAALRAIDRLQALAESQDSNYYLTRAQLLRGQARIAQGQLDAGLQDMRGAIATFERLGQMVDVLDGLEREIRILRAQHAWPQAVDVMAQRQELWTQLFRNAQSRTIAELEARHRAESREQRITALATEVRLERARLHSQRLLLALAATVALLAASAAGLLYLSRRRTRRERDRLSHAARHDPLTGAYSRYEFQRRALASGTKEDGRQDGRCLLLLDLDDFKSINDGHGHEAGDAVLKEVVARLRRQTRHADEIYRWGGEEFLLVLSGRDQDALGQDVAAMLDGVSRDPVVWHEHKIAVALSGGLVTHPLSPSWTAPLGDAIRWADSALYAAKRAGRRQVLQVTVTSLGEQALSGRRPIDTVQLQDWVRQGYAQLTTVQASHPPTA
ncbi:tetratricopeptide repeat-containing diguanylate cyclase [Thermomonas sp. HDW16]|uniref:tetratricopeptide repeat-containing diguanylate cyclase n=1 Tax=Thermomonas sp. HDW16 TaxID=2714945 RepID=UPI00140745F8|nr:tetratricopeptide repeat-containing diguanylate cyclase [Thermomonas sp. HDW16]QIL20824.1 GGDEF domain-containing protein [Thermomonas sp. HDW16]